MHTFFAYSEKAFRFYFNRTKPSWSTFENYVHHSKKELVFIHTSRSGHQRSCKLEEFESPAERMMSSTTTTTMMVNKKNCIKYEKASALEKHKRRLGNASSGGSRLKSKSWTRTKVLLLCRWSTWSGEGGSTPFKRSDMKSVVFALESFQSY